MAHTRDEVKASHLNVLAWIVVEFLSIIPLFGWYKRFLSCWVNTAAFFYIIKAFSQRSDNYWDNCHLPIPQFLQLPEKIKLNIDLAAFLQISRLAQWSPTGGLRTNSVPCKIFDGSQKKICDIISIFMKRQIKK